MKEGMENSARFAGQMVAEDAVLDVQTQCAAAEDDEITCDWLYRPESHYTDSSKQSDRLIKYSESYKKALSLARYYCEEQGMWRNRFGVIKHELLQLEKSQSMGIPTRASVAPVGLELELAKYRAQANDLQAQTNILRARCGNLEGYIKTITIC